MSNKTAKRNRSGRSRVDVTGASSGPGWRAYLHALGPGLVTGASDDDPSGIATYSQAGSQFRYGLLWASLITLPLMAAVQEICDRTALATGKGLGELAVRRFPRLRIVIGSLLVALIIANVLNITADVVAIGEGMNLLGAGPAFVWTILAGVTITGLVIGGSFETVARVFKILCAALLSYILVLFVVHADWGQVFTRLLIPHVTLSRDYVLLLVAVLGTTISPYLFFWQSAHRVEELRDEPRGGSRAVSLKGRSARESRHKQRTSRVDVFGGMIFSNLVMFSIIVATASTLGAHGSNQITSAAHAAQALRPFAGDLAKVLFAVGFVASGMLAIPILAGSGSVGMAGLVRKDWGFSKSPRRAPFFYGLVVAGVLGGTTLTALNVDPVQLLVYVALINGLLAGPMLVVVMLVSQDRQIMGEHVNRRLATILGWATTLLMTSAAAAYLTINYL